MSMIGKKVIIRTINAGVHFGTLASLDGQTAILNQARRIWYWKGAFTLSEIAMMGVKSHSKISTIVPEILLNETIEVIPCTAESAECLSNFPVYLE